MNASSFVLYLLSLQMARNTAAFDASTNESFFDCRGVLGCFPTGPPWQSKERVISLKPMAFHEIKPTFCLYSHSRHRCHKLNIFDRKSIEKAPLTWHSELVFLTHGFLDSADLLWMQNIVRGVLRKKNTAVITVDWKLGANPPYAQAVANIRLVGAVTGRLIHLLMVRKGVQLSKMHLAGHSLGSHLFGYTGTYIKRVTGGPLVGRITGLDPAGPYFKTVPPEVRLDKSDAKLVIGIHTDSTPLIPLLPESLGIAEAVGHVDFFPDGGGKQNGCQGSPQKHINALKDVGEGIVRYVSCNHRKSYKYFLASLHGRCEMIGIECSSWEKFERGNCWDCSEVSCYKMGFHFERFFPNGQASTRLEAIHAEVDNQFGNGVHLFLSTAPDERECGTQVRITVVSRKTVDGPNKTEGINRDILTMVELDDEVQEEEALISISITVRGAKGTAKTSHPQKNVRLAAGGSVRWVDNIGTVGHIRSIVFHHVSENSFIQNFFWNTSPKFLSFKEIIYEELQTGRRFVFKFCEPLLQSNEPVLLKRRSCKTNRRRIKRNRRWRKRSMKNKYARKALHSY